MKRVYDYETTIGKIGIAEEDDRITHLFFESEETPEGYERKETPVLKEACKQLQEYFSGKRKGFTLPLAPSGTEFMQKVWNALCVIPYGETRSYKDIAAAIGSSKAYRAVGMANNRNPIAIMIPCHRVIGADGKLVGYAAGLDIKKFLLELEKKNK